jgi:hypothetical protein
MKNMEVEKEEEEEETEETEEQEKTNIKEMFKSDVRFHQPFISIDRSRMKTIDDNIQYIVDR